MTNEMKDQLHTRRQFFKRSAKVVLPILGLITFSFSPLIAKANRANGCQTTCYGRCTTTCFGCSSQCTGCTGGCTGVCKGCENACRESCSAGCQYECQGGCRDGCTKSGW